MEDIKSMLRKSKDDAKESTIDTYSKALSKLYRTLKGLDKKDNIDNIKNIKDWIYQEEDILKIIKNMTSHSTRKTYLTGMINLLSYDNKNSETLKNFILEAKENRKDMHVQNKDKSKFKKDKKDTISYKDLVNFVNELKKDLYSPQGSSYDTYILFNIYLKFPFRNEVGSFIFIDNKDFAKIPKDIKNQNNYLVASTRDLKIVRNKYKTSDTYGSIITTIEDKNLKSLIRKYVKDKNIKSGGYLFLNSKKNNHISSDEVSHKLSFWSKKYMDKTITANDIFKIRILDKFNDLENKTNKTNETTLKREFLEEQGNLRGTQLDILIKEYLIK